SFLLSRAIDNITESISFHLAIFIASLFAGPQIGLLIAISGTLLLWRTDTDFLGHGDAAHLTQVVNLCLFTASAALSIWLATSLRRAMRDAQEAEELQANVKPSVIVPFRKTSRRKLSFKIDIRDIWKGGASPNSLMAYAVALFLVIVATVVRYAVGWAS